VQENVSKRQRNLIRLSDRVHSRDKVKHIKRNNQLFIMRLMAQLSNAITLRDATRVLSSYLAIS